MKKRRSSKAKGDTKNLHWLVLTMLLVFRRVHCVWGNYFITGLGFSQSAARKEKINVATPTILAGEKKRYSEYFFFFFQIP